MEESTLPNLPTPPEGYHWHMAWWDFRLREAVWQLEKNDPPKPVSEAYIDEEGRSIFINESGWSPPYGD